MAATIYYEFSGGTGNYNVELISGGTTIVISAETKTVSGAYTFSGVTDGTYDILITDSNDCVIQFDNIVVNCTTLLNNYTIRLTGKQVDIVGGTGPLYSGLSWTYQVETTPALEVGDEIDVVFYFSGYTDGSDAGIGLTISNSSEYIIDSGSFVDMVKVDNADWSTYPNPPLNPITGATGFTMTGSSSTYEIRLASAAVGTAGSTYIAENEFYIQSAVGSAGSVGTVTIDNSETSKFTLSGTL